MISEILTLVRKDFKLLIRENTFLIILSVFLLMSLASTYISWSSQHMVQQVYDEASRQVIKAGKPLSLSPFSSTQPLSVMKNMIIYVVLIGALLAITLGHLIAINDRKAGAIPILFSKSFSKQDFFWGKILVSIGMLFIALLLSLIISTISVALINGISLPLFLSIVIFYAVSFVYLTGFSYIGIFFGLKADNSSKAILLPLILWIIITFALPEFGSALYPTSSLNPVLPDSPVLNSPVLTTFHSIAYPFSISEQYKEATATILGLPSVGTNIPSYPQGNRLLILFVWLSGTLGLSYYAVKNFDAAKGDIYE